MIAKRSPGIFAVVMLVALALACGCTGTSDSAQAPGTEQEGAGMPPMNGTAPGRGGQPQQMDFASSAATLGVSEEALMEALGVPEGMGGGGMPGGMERGAPPAAP